MTDAEFRRRAHVLIAQHESVVGFCCRYCKGIFPDHVENCEGHALIEAGPSVKPIAWAILTRHKGRPFFIDKVWHTKPDFNPSDLNSDDMFTRTNEVVALVEA